MELTIGQLIKLILGIFVVAAVVVGLYLFFKSRVIEFFKEATVDLPIKTLLSLL